MLISSGSNGITFNNNKIGTAADPNSGDGILVDDSSNIQIGLAINNGGNQIGGNRNGVNVTDGSTNVTIYNNQIGLIGPETQDGILLDNIANVTIGGSLSQQRNIISGSGDAGIRLQGAVTTNTLIQDNLIGTNAAGTAAVPNNFGVWIDQGAANNTVGGAAANQGNVISGNANNGVRIENQSNGNIVQGNRIGTDITGAMLSATALPGVYIDSSSNNQVVSAAPSPRRTTLAT